MAKKKKATPKAYLTRKELGLPRLPTPKESSTVTNAARPSKSTPKRTASTRKPSTAVFTDAKSGRNYRLVGGELKWADTGQSVFKRNPRTGDMEVDRKVHQQASLSVRKGGHNVVTFYPGPKSSVDVQHEKPSAPTMWKHTPQGTVRAGEEHKVQPIKPAARAAAPTPRITTPPTPQVTHKLDVAVPTTVYDKHGRVLGVAFPGGRFAEARTGHQPVHTPTPKAAHEDNSPIGHVSADLKRFITQRWIDRLEARSEKDLFTKVMRRRETYTDYRQMRKDEPHKSRAQILEQAKTKNETMLERLRRQNPELRPYLSTKLASKVFKEHNQFTKLSRDWDLVLKEARYHYLADKVETMPRGIGGVQSLRKSLYKSVERMRNARQDLEETKREVARRISERVRAFEENKHKWKPERLEIELAIVANKNRDDRLNIRIAEKQLKDSEAKVQKSGKVYLNRLNSLQRKAERTAASAAGIDLDEIARIRNEIESVRKNIGTLKEQLKRVKKTEAHGYKVDEYKYHISPQELVEGRALLKRMNRSSIPGQRLTQSELNRLNQARIDAGLPPLSPSLVSKEGEFLKRQPSVSRPASQTVAMPPVKGKKLPPQKKIAIKKSNVVARGGELIEAKVRVKTDGIGKALAKLIADWAGKHMAISLSVPPTHAYWYALEYGTGPAEPQGKTLKLQRPKGRFPRLPGTPAFTSGRRKPYEIVAGKAKGLKYGYKRLRFRDEDGEWTYPRAVAHSSRPIGMVRRSITQFAKEMQSDLGHTRVAKGKLPTSADIESELKQLAKRFEDILEKNTPDPSDERYGDDQRSPAHPGLALKDAWQVEVKKS